MQIPLAIFLVEIVYGDGDDVVLISFRSHWARDSRSVLETRSPPQRSRQNMLTPFRANTRKRWIARSRNHLVGVLCAQAVRPPAPGG
jgi:hypothetical protein